MIGVEMKERSFEADDSFFSGAEVERKLEYLPLPSPPSKFHSPPSLDHFKVVTVEKPSPCAQR